METFLKSRTMAALNVNPENKFNTQHFADE